MKEEHVEDLKAEMVELRQKEDEIVETIDRLDSKMTEKFGKSFHLLFITLPQLLWIAMIFWFNFGWMGSIFVLVGGGCFSLVASFF